MPEVLQRDMSKPAADPERRTAGARYRPTQQQHNAIYAGTIIPSQDDDNLFTSTPSARNSDEIHADLKHLQIPSDLENRAALLLRVLVDILVFSYGVNGPLLDSALAEWSPDLRLRKGPIGVPSLLDVPDRRMIQVHSETVHKACEKVAQNHHSLLKNEECAFIITHIIQPARLLKIEPGYMFEQLMAFRSHGCRAEYRKKTLLYNNTISFWPLGRGFLPSKWGVDKKQRLLALRLVSDDIAIAKLGALTCERLQLLIGNAIKQFGEKNCKFGMGRVRREVYVEPTSTALVEELERWEIMITRESYHGSYQSARLETQYYTAPHRGIEHHTKRSVRKLSSIDEVDEHPARSQSAFALRRDSVPQYSPKISREGPRGHTQHGEASRQPALSRSQSELGHRNASRRR